MRSTNTAVRIDAELFKQTMRQWVAGVTVITVGEPPNCHGMTANSFTPLSMSPPLFLICIDRNNETHGMLAEGVRVGINLLSDSQIEISQHFARKTANREDFTDLPWYPGPRGATLFQGCAATMEAQIINAYAGGDHTIFVGEILSAHCDGERPTLLYSRGTYGRFAVPEPLTPQVS